jgi:pyruvate/2-oxoglutarate dehydrogenase complex dihydrolipoamide acyltransferase (E2) component
MKTMRYRFPQLTIFAGIAILLIGQSSESMAQQPNLGRSILGGFLGGLQRAAAVENARRSWAQVDQQIQLCLVDHYHASPVQLVQRGIPANDQRVIPYINSCVQLIAANQQRQQQEQARQEQELAAQQAQAQAAEQARQEQEASAVQAAVEQKAEAERQAKEAAAAAAAQQAALDARKAQLTSKFGSEVAGEIMSGMVRAGMNKDAVLAAKGSPAKREVIPPDDELWYYGMQRIAFSKGKVTYVSQ